MSAVYSNEMEIDEAVTVSLRALSWVLSVPARASRFLALTGLDPQELRARMEDPSLLVACISFLEAYQPDLIACAEAIDCRPETIVAAARRLEQ
jgi:hypothetical protein